ncbi:MAG TPA: amino acid permease [Blastocatellia bacterium]|nr:amino acid permease [Blastocatellia bacterium]
METKQADKSGVKAMTFRGLFRIKSLDSILKDAEEPEHKLNRALGPVQLTLFGIGAIIGAGIFATIGTAAAGDANRPGAGPALMVSFIITAIVCGFTALCYAEFASMVPISGSAYTYSYATLGEVIAWIIGWDLIIEYAVGNIAVAISWANYFKTLLAGLKMPSLGIDGIHIPDWISMDYRTAAKIVDEQGVQTVYRDAPHIFGIPIIFNILAVLIVAFITLVLIWGIRESAKFNATMVGIKILVLTFFIIVGFTYVQPANWHPFNPNGFAGISAGAAIVFFAYIGFDAVSTVAEETKNPQRNLPIGIIASLIICTIFYAVVAAVFTGLISYGDLKTKLATEQAEPLTMALEHVGQQFGTNLNWAIGIVAFGSVIAHTAVLLVFQLGQPRILFSMARDGLLPKAFQKVHPKYRTPHVATILTGVFVAAFAAVASIDEMVDLTNIGTLFAFILVCAGIIVLRVKDPSRPRPFRVPGGLVIPILGIVSCLYLIYYLPPTSWLRFAAWLNLGFVIYVGYGSVHSRLTGQHTSEQPAEHAAETAYTGAWLGLIGTALLFFMRGFDLWLEALKNTDRTGSAIGELMKLGPWLDVSWFLIVPLALNVFVLCPIVLKRAMATRASGKADRHASNISVCMAIAALVAVVGIIYLLLVVLHNK